MGKQFVPNKTSHHGTLVSQGKVRKTLGATERCCMCHNNSSITRIHSPPPEHTPTPNYCKYTTFSEEKLIIITQLVEAMTFLALDGTRGNGIRFGCMIVLECYNFIRDILAVLQYSCVRRIN